MLKYLIKRPMLLCAALCCLVSVVAFYSRAALLVCGLICVFFISILCLKTRNMKLIFVMSLVFLMILSSFFTLGNIRNIQRLDNTKTTADLIICEVTDKSENYHSASAEIISCDILKKGTKLKLFYAPIELNNGSTVKAELKISFSKDTKFKAQNYSQEIYITASAKNIKPSSYKADFVYTATEKVRSYIRNTLFGNVSKDEAATLCALIFGDKSYFSAEFYENVKCAGVSHVMVVSGLHLSVIITLFTLLVDKLFYNRYMKALVILAAVIMITALCGFTMSILRAGLTFVFVAISLILGRGSAAENSLGSAVTLILIISPFAIFSVAFRLSILSTFGILAVALPITRYLKSREIIKSEKLLLLVCALITTLSAMLLTLPTAISIFGYVSIVSPITNLLISFAVTILLWITVCALLINLFLPSVASLLFVACEVIAKYVNLVINFLGSLKFSAIRTPEWTAILAAFLIIFVFHVLLACKTRKDMLKLKEMREKIAKEGGKVLKWR